MTRLRIPTRWDAVTPEWMTAAIAPRCPDACVGAVRLVTTDDGTNRRARFAIDYAAGAGPASVFLKAHAPSHRWVHFRNGNLFNEARLFRSGEPLPVDHPLVYSAVVDRLHLDFLLVMEDLVARDADPRDATRPMTVAQVADGLRGLARLHSHYWRFSGRTHPRLRWMRTWQVSKGWTLGLAKRIPTGIARAEGTLPAEVARHSPDELLGFWATYVASLSRGPMTLLHSDAHIGNTYVLPGDRVGFLDWQVVRRGEWSQDVGSFLIAALTVEDRRAHEAALLDEYARALEVPAGERPSAAALWDRYRASAAYGLGVWLSTLGTDGYQPRPVSLALAQRYAAAFADLETRAALENG